MFLKLSSFYFFFYITIGIYLIYLPKILETIKYSSMQIGIILATIPAVRFTVPFIFLKKLKLTDKILYFSLFLTVLGATLLIFTIKNYYLLLLSSLIMGIAMTILYPYMETITMDILKEKYGKSRLFGSIGFIFISFAASRYSNNYKLLLIFYLIASIIYSFTAFEIIKKAYKNKEEENIKNKLNFFKHRGFWLSVFLIQVSFGAYYNFFTIYETDNNISIKTVGYLWSFSVICEIIILFFQNRLLKFNLLKIIKISILITSLRWFLLYIYPQNIFISFVSQTMHAISFALYYSATILYLYKIYENNRKLAMLFLSGLSYGLGGLAGALFSGKFYGENIFLYSSLIALLGGIVLYLDNTQNNEG